MTGLPAGKHSYLAMIWMAGVMWTPFAAWAEDPSREYIRVGGRVIAIESYPAVSLPTSSATPDATGGVFTVRVTANEAWGAQSSATAWLRVNSATSTEISYIVDANTTQTDRTGTITVALQNHPAISKTFTVIQSGHVGNISLSVAPTTQTFGSSGGAETFTVTATGSWTAASDATAWAPITSTTTGSVSYTVAANTTQAERVAHITVTLAGSPSTNATFTIVQHAPAAPGTVIAVPLSPNPPFFPSTGGANNTIGITVSGTASWTAAVDSGSATWLTLTSSTSGTANATLTYTVLQNPTVTPRQGAITVTSGPAVIPITITQSGLSISVSPTSFSGLSDNGASVQITVTTPAEMNWHLTVADWIHPAQYSGTGGPTAVSVTIDANSGPARTGTIKINDVDVVTVTQVACSISVSPTYKWLPGAGGAFPVSVTSAQSWAATVSPADGWIGITSPPNGQGSGNGAIGISASANFALADREGTVNVNAARVVVHQARTSAAEPTNVAVTPVNGQGSSQGFTFAAASANGSHYVSEMQVLFSSTNSTTNSCQIVALAPFGTPSQLTLRGNGGDDLIRNLADGSGPGTAENNQCTVSASMAAYVQSAGNEVQLSVTVTFKQAFAGVRNIYMLTRDQASLSSLGGLWQKMGTWTTSSAYVAPANVALAAGISQQFVANGVTGPLTWSVSPAGGPGGSITNTGLYTAPTVVPSGSSAMITVSNGSISANATVNLVPISISVAPRVLSLIPGESTTFAATVENQNAANPGVDWSISPAPAEGEIASAGPYAGTYTAPATVISPHTVTIIATSRADRTKAASSTVTVLPAPAWYNANWTSRRIITIDHTKVSGSSSLQNFPVAVVLTEPDLRTTAYQGKTALSGGGDIFFVSAATGQKLAHEIEKYVDSSGELVAWVRVPQLSPTTDTVLYMYFGNAAAANQQDRTNVWDSSFKGVWHFSSGTALSTNDSTANGNNGIASGTSPTLTAGVIAGSGLFGTSRDIRVMNPSNLPAANSARTFSGWLRKDAPSGPGWLFTYGPFTSSYVNCQQGTCLAGNEWGMSTVDLTTLRIWTTNWKERLTLLTPGEWHHVAITFDGAGWKLWLNGVNSSGGADADVANTQVATLFFGQKGDGTGYFNGALDEFRISSAARSAEWIATEYNNQSDPVAFLSAGPTQGHPKAASITRTPISPGVADVTLTASRTNASQPVVLMNLVYSWDVDSIDSCYIQYNHTANALYLVSDDATQLLGGHAPGSPNVVSNSQCRIDYSNTSVSLTGTSLALTVRLTLLPAYVGRQLGFLYAQDSAGTGSGWLQGDTWTAYQASTTPPATQVYPASGQSMVGEHAFTVISPNGYKYLIEQQLRFGGTTNANSCVPTYWRNWNVVQLADDGGINGVAYPLGSGHTLSNSQCTIDLSRSTRELSSPNGSRVTFHTTFNSNYLGTKTISGVTYNHDGTWSTLGTLGSWTVGAARATVSPSEGAGGALRLTGSFVYPGGLGGVSEASALIQSSTTSVGACQVMYNLGDSKFYLLNDAGNVWLGPISPSTATSVENTQCKLSGANSYASTTSTSITAHFDLAFKGSFNGTKNIYLYYNNTWLYAGEWTVTVP